MASVCQITFAKHVLRAKGHLSGCFGGEEKVFKTFLSCFGHCRSKKNLSLSESSAVNQKHETIAQLNQLNHSRGGPRGGTLVQGTFSKKSTKLRLVGQKCRQGNQGRIKMTQNPLQVIVEQIDCRLCAKKEERNDFRIFSEKGFSLSSRSTEIGTHSTHVIEFLKRYS